MDCVLAETGGGPSVFLVIAGVAILVLGAALVLRRTRSRAVGGALVLGGILMGAAAFAVVAPQPAVAGVHCAPSPTPAPPVATPTATATPAPTPTTTPDPTPSSTPTATPTATPTPMPTPTATVPLPGEPTPELTKP